MGINYFLFDLRHGINLSEFWSGPWYREVTFIGECVGNDVHCFHKSPYRRNECESLRIRLYWFYMKSKKFRKSNRIWYFRRNIYRHAIPFFKDITQDYKISATKFRVKKYFNVNFAYELVECSLRKIETNENTDMKMSTKLSESSFSF